MLSRMTTVSDPTVDKVSGRGQNKEKRSPGEESDGQDEVQRWLIRGRKGVDMGGNRFVAIVSLSTLMTMIVTVVIDEYKMIISMIIMIMLIGEVEEKKYWWKKETARSKSNTA